jgi:hypothetical protein
MAQVIKQTPDQLLAELERLGEKTVREKLDQGHFAAYKVSLIEGWLQRKEDERQRVIDEQRATERRNEERRERRVLIDAKEGRSNAQRALMLAMAATVMSGVALLLSLLALLGLGR